MGRYGDGCIVGAIYAPPISRVFRCSFLSFNDLFLLLSEVQEHQCDERVLKHPFRDSGNSDVLIQVAI